LTILQAGHQYVDPYIHGRDSTEGTSLSGPRALKRCARRETRRSASILNLNFKFLFNVNFRSWAFRNCAYFVMKPSGCDTVRLNV
jgi:hypothetical protein